MSRKPPVFGPRHNPTTPGYESPPARPQLAEDVSEQRGEDPFDPERFWPRDPLAGLDDTELHEAADALEGTPPEDEEHAEIRAETAARLRRVALAAVESALINERGHPSIRVEMQGVSTPETREAARRMPGVGCRRCRRRMPTPAEVAQVLEQAINPPIPEHSDSNVSRAFHLGLLSRKAGEVLSWLRGVCASCSSHEHLEEEFGP